MIKWRSVRRVSWNISEIRILCFPRSYKSHFFRVPTFKVLAKFRLSCMRFRYCHFEVFLLFPFVDQESEINEGWTQYWKEFGPGLVLQSWADR